uniref:Uncharacterized protein n=1 Tax=Hyaloperonospora arabidopsidis (strain Emoy2) TaxID=559515 RepID=M4B681_HYAAE
MFIVFQRHQPPCNVMSPYASVRIGISGLAIEHPNQRYMLFAESSCSFIISGLASILVSSFGPGCLFRNTAKAWSKSSCLYGVKTDTAY